jgi:hypothetical protein
MGDMNITWDRKLKPEHIEYSVTKLIIDWELDTEGIISNFAELDSPQWNYDLFEEFVEYAIKNKGQMQMSTIQEVQVENEQTKVSNDKTLEQIQKIMENDEKSLEDIKREEEETFEEIDREYHQRQQIQESNLNILFPVGFNDKDKNSREIMFKMFDSMN